jgi:MerR family Zn(II)-responsive transcriptional regulator of zntA
MTTTALKIGEFSKNTGVAIDTLRYYEKIGLLKADHRSGSGYRFYGDQSLARIKFILSAKGLGFSLKDIKELLSIQINKQANSCENVKALTEKQLADIEKRLQELQRIRDAVADLHNSCCGGPEDARYCSILQALEKGNV